MQAFCSSAVGAASVSAGAAARASSAPGLCLWAEWPFPRLPGVLLVLDRDQGAPALLSPRRTRRRLPRFWAPGSVSEAICEMLRVCVALLREGVLVASCITWLTWQHCNLP